MTEHRNQAIEPIRPSFSATVVRLDLADFDRVEYDESIANVAQW